MSQNNNRIFIKLENENSNHSSLNQSEIKVSTIIRNVVFMSVGLVLTTNSYSIEPNMGKTVIEHKEANFSFSGHEKRSESFDVSAIIEGEVFEIMSYTINKDAFDQFEKRIDDKIDNLDTKLDKMAGTLTGISASLRTKIDKEELTTIISLNKLKFIEKVIYGILGAVGTICMGLLIAYLSKVLGLQ